MALASPASAATWPTKLGDLDQDDQVTVLDLVRLINHLNQTALLPDPLPFFADVNQDGFLNQADVDALGDIILGRAPVVLFSLTTIRETSPAAGESGVAVTRETIFRFSQPLATNTFLTTNHLYATFGGANSSPASNSPATAAPSPSSTSNTFPPAPACVSPSLPWPSRISSAALSIPTATASPAA